MSDRKTKRQKDDVLTYATFEPPLERLPITCKDSVRNHINSVYVGTIIRIYDNSYGPAGHLVTAHWITDQGIFATLHDDSKSDFVRLKYKTWVVDQRHVRPGSFRLFKRFGTDDIKNDSRKHTINEIKQMNSRVMTNNTLMDFPTQADRETFSCSLFRLTCNCGMSKKAKVYTCADSNVKNSGKRYYACLDRYKNSTESCNFFVWQEEIEHENYITCECGVLCKRINVSKEGFLPVHKFICVNRGNKYHKGCNFSKDG